MLQLGSRPVSDGSIDPGASSPAPRGGKQTIRLGRVDRDARGIASCDDLDGPANRASAPMSAICRRDVSIPDCIRLQEDKRLRRAWSLKNRSSSVAAQLLGVADPVSNAGFGHDQAAQAPRLGGRQLATDRRDVDVELVALVHVLGSPHRPQQPSAADDTPAIRHQRLQHLVLARCQVHLASTVTRSPPSIQRTDADSPPAAPPAQDRRSAARTRARSSACRTASSGSRRRPHRAPPPCRAPGRGRRGR